VRLLALSVALLACPATLPQQVSSKSFSAPAVVSYAGFDRNDYPGDAALPELRKHFDFVGYWLTNPPGESTNSWAGKREILLREGFGFVAVANGRLDKEILRSAKQGMPPAALAQRDAAAAVAVARREGFPARTIIFLDQEEGGRLLDEQAAYLLAWTEAVAASDFLPGVYASGEPVADGKGPDGKPVTITTIQDIRARVSAGHLHTVAFWVTLDACPPAPGCVLAPPPPDMSGVLDATAWQYAQSPRRKSKTQACGKTYASDGNCDTPAPARYDVDLSSAPTPDPSHGR
jgi:hypothetical protein